jgi:tRNA-binding protein
METITWNDFEKVRMHVGTIISAQVFEKARNPAYQLEVDFGTEIGMKRSSAQITKLYQPEELIGRQVVAVINFPVKQIANFFSECLVLGVVGDEKEIVLLQPDRPVKNGHRIA